MHLVPPAYCYTVGSFRMSRVRIGTVTERTERTAVRRKQDGSRWLTSRWLTSACHHPAGRSSRDVSPYEMCHLTRPPRPNACQTSALLPPPTTSPISARNPLVPSRARSLRNLLVSGNECGRVFPAGVGPGSPSRDAANWLPSRFSLSVETRRRYGWLRMMVFPGARLFPSPNLVPFGRVAARERQGALSRRAW